MEAVNSIAVIKSFFSPLEVSTKELKELSRDERLWLAGEAAKAMGWERGPDSASGPTWQRQ